MYGLQQLWYEVDLLKRARHPCIVEPLMWRVEYPLGKRAAKRAGGKHGRSALIMELAEGGTLKKAVWCANTLSISGTHVCLGHHVQTTSRRK